MPKNLIYHNPVQLQTAIDWLNVQPGAKYIDATYGAGRHAEGIRKLGGLVLGIDQDRETEADVHTNFSHLKEIVLEKKWQPLAGILLDLGVSQYQFGQAQRGFSIQKDGPLDMRMNQETQITAANIVNEWPIKQLASLLKDFGELPNAQFLAKKIIAARPLTTTNELVNVVNNLDIARQVFQALRIAVNDELGALESVLPQAHDVLASGGRLVIISFHSLEDRLVKQAFKSWHDGTVLTPKPILGERNSKLRAWEKI